MFTRHSPPSAEFWRDPSMEHVETRRACHSRACYKAHSHPTFSVGAVDAGASHFTGVSGGPAALYPGMMVFIPAGCVHACNPLPDDCWSYQMLHLDAAWLRQLLAETGPSSAGLIRENEIRLTDNQTVYARFCQLNDTLFSAASTEDKNAALIEFIGDCACENDLVETYAAQLHQSNGALARVISQLQETERPPLPLEDLAKTADMSRYQLIRAFRAVTGMTPHAYQLNRRVNQARQWLQSGAEITDIAYRLGFADQSHFQRVFKAHTGVTPGCYRA